MVGRRARLAATTLTCLLAVAGCEAAATRATLTVRDSAGIRIVENPLLPVGAECALAEAPDLDIGVVDGPPEQQLFRVADAATLSDGRVAVVNRGSSEVRVFRPDGRFDMALGGEGDGPGELRSAARVWILPGDTLVVGEDRPVRLSTFSPEGAFLRTTRIAPPYRNPPVAIEVSSDGSAVIAQHCCFDYGAEWEWFSRELHVLWHRRDGAVGDTLFVLPWGLHAQFSDALGMAGRQLFTPLSAVTAGRGRLAVGRAERREVEVHPLPPAGAPSMLIRWEGADRTVSGADIAAYRDWELARPARLGRAGDDVFVRAVRVLASERRVANDRFPAHAELRLGADGSLWVQEYPRRPEAVQEWFVFHDTGELECTVRLPFTDARDLYEVDLDHVIGMERDDLEVEHVRRYRLISPPHTERVKSGGGP